MNNKLKGLISTLTILLTLSTISTSVFAKPTVISTKIRLGGQNRYETAIEISKEFAKDDTITNCIIGRDDDYADSISVAPLSVYLNAPLLLTEKDTLNTETQARLKDMGIKNVYIIGGTGVISTNVEDKLKALGYNVTRLGGANRIETNRLIMAQIPVENYGYNPKIINGEDWVQGMSIAMDTKLYYVKENKVYINPIFVISSSASKPEDFKDIADILTPVRNTWEAKAPGYYEVKIDYNVRKTVGYTNASNVIFSSIITSLYKTNGIPSCYKHSTTDANLSINSLYESPLHETGIPYQVQGALLTRGDNFIDALAVTPLAAKHREPVVMATVSGKVTSGAAIMKVVTGTIYNDEAKKYQFTRVYDLVDTVYYIGGPAVVPDGSESFLSGN